MPRKKKIDGLQRLLDFVEFLREEGVYFSLHSKSNVSITVDFELPGIRFEADFYPDHMVFAHFPGSEDVSHDDDLLDRLLQKHGAGEISRNRPPSNA
jgi:hypothetical protein